MPESKIVVKGKTPTLDYDYTLTEVFRSFEDVTFNVWNCINELKEEGIEIGLGTLENELFSYREKKHGHKVQDRELFFAGPFKMESVLNSFFLYNLNYQDNVIKIEIEEIILANNEGSLNKQNYKLVHAKILKILSIILRTLFFNQKPLFLDLTNIELDFVVLKTIRLTLKKAINKKIEQSHLISTGITANKIASIVQQNLCNANTSLEEVLTYTIFSGVIWWSTPKVQSEFETDSEKLVNSLQHELENKYKQGLKINDFPSFQREILNKEDKIELLYFIDDNGELVWSLLFIKRILEFNQNISITAVVNGLPVTNNANKDTIYHALNDNPMINELLAHKRFSVWVEKNELPAIDLRFCTDQLIKKIETSDYVIVNGVSFFEKLQNLPVPVYYLFTVWSYVSTVLTGLKEFDGVFARLPANSFAFGNIIEKTSPVSAEINLSKTHQAFKG